MEYQKMNSVKVIDQQQQNIGQINGEYKFKRINDTRIHLEDFDHSHIIYQDTIKQYQDFNEHLFQIQRFSNPSEIINNNNGINKNVIQEPFRPEIKVKINVQKSPHLSKTKSQYQSTISIKRHLSIGRGKTHTGTRFSNSSSQKYENNPLKNSRIDGSDSQVRYLSSHKDYQAQNEQKINKNLPNNKIRVKSSTVSSLSTNLNQQRKLKKFIPLKQFQAKQPQSYFQNAYRKKRQHQSLWNSNLNHWKSEENQKRNLTKVNLYPKQMKNVVYQGYDFDGQLIPSFQTAKKQKKSKIENQKVLIEPSDEYTVENLKDYNQRKQTKIKTIKQVRFQQHTQLNQEQSQFLKNFQNLQWKDNIKHVQIQQIEIEKGSHSIKDILSSKKLTIIPSFKIIGKEKIQTDVQGDNNSYQSKLISEFQKIKHAKGQSQNEEVNKNLQINFSNYVKAKNFQQKQAKSKSYNYQTDKYLPPAAQNQNEKIFTLKIKQASQKKGPQKIRANKRLFKQLFNVSLKHLQPQNREDIATIKLIKDKQKQNMEMKDTQNYQRQQKQKLTRKSDTALLKKEFQIKAKFLNQFAKDDKLKFPSRNRLESQDNQSQFTFNQDSILQSSSHRFSQASTPSISKRKISISEQRKSLANFSANHDTKNLHNIFKKDTKKVLFKHSINESRKQNFQ